MPDRTVFGPSAALITPFSEGDAPDLARLAGHAEWVLANGCDSMTLFGTTGEGFSIGIRDRAAMLGAVFGAGIAPSASTQPSLLPPWPTPPTRRSTPVPLTCSSRRPSISRLVSRLRTAFPDMITGIKDYSGDWATAEAFLAAHGDLAILVGDERLLGRAMARGCKARSAASPASPPELLSGVIHAGADEPRLIPAVNMVVANPVMPAVKALVAHGLGDPGYARTRPPLVDLDPPRAASLARDFEALMAPAEVG